MEEKQIRLQLKYHYCFHFSFECKETSSKYSEILSTFLFLSSIKRWLSGLEFTKQTQTTLIKLLIQKQSDLGLRCLSMPFKQATTSVVFKFFELYSQGNNLHFTQDSCSEMLLIYGHQELPQICW